MAIDTRKHFVITARKGNCSQYRFADRAANSDILDRDYSQGVQLQCRFAWGPRRSTTHNAEVLPSIDVI